VLRMATLNVVEVGAERWATVGGVHRVPVSNTDGGLYLCGLDAVGADPRALMEHVGAETLVCLVSDIEILRRHPDYLDWISHPAPHEVIRLPTDDHLVAADEAVVSLVTEILRRLGAGSSVVVHCGAGWGRAGVIAVLTMVAAGATVDDAIRDLRSARPAAGPESMEQDLQIERLAPKLGGLSG